MSAQCCFRVYGVGRGFIGSNCRVKAIFEHEGHAYCRMHYPPNVDAKDAARRQKWVAETAMEERLRSERIEQKRRADLYPELLAALTRAAQSAGFQYMTFETRELIDSAMAKATGAA